MRAPLKRIQKFVCAALIAASFQGIQAARADWSNFGTVSMTDSVTPKLTNGYLCYSDGRDIACNTSAGPVYIGTNGLINNGGMTVAGSVSASAVSATYVSATVLQINPSTMPCSTGLNGTIRYSSVSSTLEVCVGTNWTTLSSNTAPGNISGNGSATAITFWSGANSLSYDSGLYWDNANKRLGIGTTAPGYPLTVSSSGNAQLGIVGTGNQTSIILVSGSQVKWSIGANNFSPNSDFFVYDSVGVRNILRAFPNGALSLMSAGGNVGVGTIAPTAALQVSGTFTVSNSGQTESPSFQVGSGPTVGIGVNPNTVDSARARLYMKGLTDRSDIMLATGAAEGAQVFAGTVGFNGGASVASNTDARIALISAFTSGTTTGNRGGVLRFTTKNDNGLLQNTITMDQMGNLGIGTFNTPGSSLTVVNGEVQTGSSGQACVTSTNGGAIRYSAGSLSYCNGANIWTALSTGGGTLTGGGSATAVAFWSGPSSLTYESATTSGLYWDHNNRRLGLGTNAPSTTLHLYGVGASGNVGMRMTGSGPMSDGEVWGENALYQQYIGAPLVGRTYWLGRINGRPDFVIETRGVSNALVVNGGSGTVGIGTLSTTATLDVSGTGNFSGLLTANANASTTLKVNAGYGANYIFMGDSGCGGRGGIRFGGAMGACTDYALSGDASNTYFNAPTGGVIYSRINNNSYFSVRSTGAIVGFPPNNVGPSQTLHVMGSALTTSWTGINFSSASNVTATAPLEVSGSVSATAITVAGEARVSNSGASCAANTNGGAIRYTSGTGIQYCNGSNAWTTLGAGGGTLTGTGSATAVAFWNGANSLTYETSATGGLYWNSTLGRLGVGTNNALEGITISTSTANGLSIRATSPSAFTQVVYYGTSRTYSMGVGNSAAGQGLANNFFIWDSTGGAVRMAVTPSGSVGFGGTTTPTATVQVSGTFTVSNSNQVTTPSIYVASNGNVGVGSATPAGLFSVGGTSGTVIDSVGNIMLGGAPPASLASKGLLLANLHDATGVFQGSIQYNTPGSLPGIIFYNASGAARAQLKLLTANGGLSFAASTGSTNPGDGQMVLATNGNVGISNTNPIAKLDVVGTISASDAIQVGQSTLSCINGISGSIRFNTSSNTLQVCTNAGWVSLASGTTAGGSLTGTGSATAVAFWNGANSLTYDSGLYWDNGNKRLGVGTSAPTMTLDVSSSAANSDTQMRINVQGSGFSYSPILHLNRVGATDWTLRQPVGGYHFVIDQDGVRRLTIQTGTGNTGIGGVVTPTATLQVSGTFTVSQTGQNTASAASMLVDERGVSVSSIVHINGSAFSPIGAGGNVILSGTAAVSTSSAGSITFYTGGAERMQIGANGNVGVGTSHLTAPLALQADANSQGLNIFGRAADDKSAIVFYNRNGTNPNNFAFIQSGPTYLAMATSNTERVRIDANGNVGIANNDPTSTPNPGLSLLAGGILRIGNSAGVTGQGFVTFHRSGTQIGSITQNGTTAVAYNTTSDRRVKEDITDTREGLQKLMQLPVRDFAFRADPSHTIVTGFIAQELEKVFPDAVTTNGDNGKTKLASGTVPWSVDYGRVTPLIVKAVQDLNLKTDGEINSLKADNDNLLAALKAANDNIESLRGEVDALRKILKPGN